MQKLRYAFGFISASFSLAKESDQLLETMLYLGVGCLAILFVGFFPLALVVGVFGLGSVGMILIGMLLILILFSLEVWGEITAVQTSQVFATLTHKVDQTTPPEPSDSSFMTHWADALVLVLTQPGLHIIDLVRRMFRSGAENRSVWLHGAYLLLPLISLENLNVEQAVDRVKQIVAGNLLRFRSDLIRVRLVARIVQCLLTLSGGALGFVIAVNIADPLTAGVWRRILGLGIGLLIGGIFTSLGLLFSSFTRTCYHTALYIWVWNVELAQHSGKPHTASPPDILRQVLGKTVDNKKEE